MEKTATFMNTLNILILEDDIEVVSLLFKILSELEQDIYPMYNFLVSSFSTYKQVEEIVNLQPMGAYDIILLDRDCLLGGSFHVLDIEKFGADKVISISSVKQWNKEAQKRGVNSIVLKDFGNLDKFASTLKAEIKRKVVSN